MRERRAMRPTLELDDDVMRAARELVTFDAGVAELAGTAGGVRLLKA